MRTLMITPNIDAVWRIAVKTYQTTLGLNEWAAQLPKEQYLALHGLYLSTRDRYVNSDLDGEWQITEYYHSDTNGRNASNEFWAIVGDDKDALIEKGIRKVEEFFKGKLIEVKDTANVE